MAGIPYKPGQWLQVCRGWAGELPYGHAVQVYGVMYAGLQQGRSGHSDGVIIRPYWYVDREEGEHIVGLTPYAWDHTRFKAIGDDAAIGIMAERNIYIFKGKV